MKPTLKVLKVLLPLISVLMIFPLISLEGLANHNPSLSCLRNFIRGDSNFDGHVDISDPINTLSFLFLGKGTIPCREAADANSSGDVDISDAIYTLEFLFIGGPAPKPPYPNSGPAETVAPRIFNVNPTSDDVLTNRRPNISAEYSDEGTGIDLLSVHLILDGADVIGQSTVTAASISFTPPQDLAVGSHTAEFSVSDRAGNVTSVKTTFTIKLPALPPELQTIGNQSVPLGTTLTLQLKAADPNNDPLAFAVVPLPLPENASFNASSGLFTFHPSANQVGSFPLTFTVSDGALTDSETITIFVEEPPVGGITGLTGRILDTNAYTEEGREVAVVGARVSLLGTNTSVASDNEGRFTLLDIPSGQQVLDIDTGPAQPAPNGSPYAGFREEIHLIAGVTNVVERPFFLPRIAQESLTPVDPNATTMVENPTLGITMEVPPHMAKNQDGSDFTGQLSISEVTGRVSPSRITKGTEPFSHNYHSASRSKLLKSGSGNFSQSRQSACRKSG